MAKCEDCPDEAKVTVVWCGDATEFCAACALVTMAQYALDDEIHSQPSFTRRTEWGDVPQEDEVVLALRQSVEEHLGVPFDDQARDPANLVSALGDAHAELAAQLARVRELLPKLRSLAREGYSHHSRVRACWRDADECREKIDAIVAKIEEASTDGLARKHDEAIVLSTLAHCNPEGTTTATRLAAVAYVLDDKEPES